MILSLLPLFFAAPCASLYRLAAFTGLFSFTMASTISSASVEPSSSGSGSAAGLPFPLAGALPPFPLPFHGSEWISVHVSIVGGRFFFPSGPGSGAAMVDHDFGAGFLSRCHFIPSKLELSGLAFTSTDSSQSIMDSSSKNCLHELLVPTTLASSDSRYVPSSLGTTRLILPHDSTSSNSSPSSGWRTSPQQGTALSAFSAASCL